MFEFVLIVSPPIVIGGETIKTSLGSYEPLVGLTMRRKAWDKI